MRFNCKMKKSCSVCLASVVGLGLIVIFSLSLNGASADFGFSISDLRTHNPKSNARRSLFGGRNLESGRPWINLRQAAELETAYAGAAGLAQVLDSSLAEPLALASADFDEDGVPDLVSGYVGPSGGILTLHQGNVDSIYPNTSEAQQRKASGTFTDAPFLSPASVINLTEAPEFIAAGDFDADGHWDVATAARGNNRLFMLTGDGRGQFAKARSVKLSGAVTALTSGEINRRDGLTDIVVGVVGAEGPQALVFESPEGAMVGAALSGRPHWEAIELPAEATALALGQLDGSYEMDLAVAAGKELVIVHGRDRKLSLGESVQAKVQPAAVEKRPFPLAIRSLALGDFVADAAHRTDIAVLGDDGHVHFLSSGDEKKNAGAHRGAPLQEMATVSVGATVSGRPSFAAQLVRAKVSSLPTDDLVVLDQGSNWLNLLITGHNQRTTDHGRRTTVSLDTGAVAILPMRLNSDALNDLVILRRGQSEPTVLMTMAAMTFTVNSTGDTASPGMPDGVCDDGAGNCTLREAIKEANNNPGADMIDFNLGSGTPTITLTNDLPTITESITIDGSAGPGGATRVELNGNNVLFINGLQFFSSGANTVRALVINRIGGAGISEFSGSGNNIIEGNFIGTNAAGTAAAPGNGFATGVQLFSPNNTIGGTTPAARNIISGNLDRGVGINGEGSQVQGNFIGTDVNGTAALGNGRGVIASGVTIGGTMAGTRNIISGSSEAGIDACGNTLVQGNFIGTNVAGTSALGNFVGVDIVDASNNTIGGTVVEARNVISGNTDDGVEIFSVHGATGNQVQGNFIGTDVTGTVALANSFGVFIGRFFSNDNTIGGSASGAGNTIAFNSNVGVIVFGTGNRISSNSIFSNGRLGIDLGDDGVTANDAGDGDAGGNDFQNFPILTSATSNGMTTIQGTLNSRLNTSYRLEFFSNTTCDPSGNGEGQTFIGSTMVMTDGSGNANINANLTVSVPAGQFITATATDPNDNTSEFSACRQVSNGNGGGGGGNLILQDERNDNRLCVDLDTGAYKFETRSHGTFTGTAIVKVFGLYITFNSGPTDANRLSGYTYSTRGQAVLRPPGGRPVFAIRDRDITNNNPCS